MRTWEVLLWWLALSGLWLLTALSPTPPEVVIGLLAALLCALLTVTCRLALGGRWRFRLRWLAWLAPLGREVLLDSVRLRPWRVAEGFTEIDLPPQASPERTAAYRCAATMVMTSSPSTVLVDERADRIVLHPLPGGHDAVRRVVQR